MYLFEWQAWYYRQKSIDERNESKEYYLEKGWELGVTITESEAAKDYSQIKRSNTPKPRGPYYAYNDRYLEIRAGAMEQRRGLITLFMIFPCVIWSIMWDMVFLIFSETRHEFNYFSLDTVLMWLLFSASLTLFLGIPFFLIKYCHRFIQLELFTYRHLRVRFNRETQQVYIQRPKFCGGTVVYRWKDTIPASLAENDELPNIGDRLTLCWGPHKTGLPYTDYAMIGKRANCGQDIVDEWEFIRRYMEEGPANLPRPRKASLLPLPWHGLAVQFEAMRGLFLPLSFFRLFTTAILLTPMLLLSGLYFVSELLCWQPRWPKVIREAGLANKPIPKPTELSDFPPEIQAKLELNRADFKIIPDADKKDKY